MDSNLISRPFYPGNWAPRPAFRARGKRIAGIRIAAGDPFAERLMGNLENALTRVIDFKQFNRDARPGCAKVFLPAAPVTAKCTESGALLCSASATTPDTDRRDETS